MRGCTVINRIVVVDLSEKGIDISMKIVCYWFDLAMRKSFHIGFHLGRIFSRA